jgi:hypothetical protein
MKAGRAAGRDGRRLDFDLERTVKDDGRYVLFYSWPARPPAPSRDDAAVRPATSAPPEQRPSSPESGPADV